MCTYTKFASLQLWHVEIRQSHIKEIEAQYSECSLKFEGLCKSFEYMKSKEYTPNSYFYILFLLLVNPKHMLYFHLSHSTIKGTLFVLLLPQIELKFTPIFM